MPSERRPAAAVPDLETESTPGPAPGPDRPAAGDVRDPAPGGGSDRAEGRSAAAAPGDLRIGAAQHVAIVGPSRSGKTYLARSLAAHVQSLVVIDVKRTHDFDDLVAAGAVVSEQPEAILYHPRVIWRPPLEEIRRPDSTGKNSFTRGLRWIYEVRGDPAGQPSVTVLVDEAFYTAPVEGANDQVLLLQVSGMGRGIGVWNLTQRPYKCNGSVFSEAIWTIAFGLQLRRDRAKLESDMGTSCEILGSLDPGHHQFMGWRQGWRQWAGPMAI